MSNSERIKTLIILTVTYAIVLCGTAVIAQSYAKQVWGQSEELIFSVEPQGSISNNPPNPTGFSLDRTKTITHIKTYHSQGQTPGSIGLRDQNGNIIGRWSASGNTYWEAYPYIDLSPGYYIVVDSDPSTWTYGSNSGGRGAAWVYAQR